MRLSFGNSLCFTRYLRSAPPTVVSTTSLTVAPGTFLRISATSASATVVASNILCGPTGTLKRVSGTPAVIPPSAIDLRADATIAGDIFISAFMNLTGDCIDEDHARDSRSALDGDRKSVV